MVKVMFVCHGNICRSPMAEFVFKKMVKDAGLEEKVQICSRATSCEEILAGKGNPIYPPAKRELTLHNIPVTEKFAERVSTEECYDYDYIIVMDSNNLRNMNPFVKNDDSLKNKIWKMLDFESVTEGDLLSDNERLTGGDIADPWYTGNFPLTYNQIEKGCKGLLNFIFSCGV